MQTTNHQNLDYAITGAPTIASLHQAFIQKSQYQLDEEQFVTLLTFYPALLVVAADGYIDEDEKVYVKQIAKFMANSYADSHEGQIRPLQNEFFQSLMFLHDEEPFFKEPFLEVLRDYLAQLPDLKDNIAEVMTMFAHSSDDISNEEEVMIKEIAEKLEMDIALFSV
jgi:tellurite resistance protein